MLLQFFKVGNITLQLLILKPYHQISSLSTLDPPAGYTPLVFFHLGLFYPYVLRSFHVAEGGRERRARALALAMSRGHAWPAPDNHCATALLLLLLLLGVAVGGCGSGAAAEVDEREEAGFTDGLQLRRLLRRLRPCQVRPAQIERGLRLMVGDVRGRHLGSGVAGGPGVRQSCPQIS